VGVGFKYMYYYETAGEKWTPITGVGEESWNGVAVSADFTKTATEYGGGISIVLDSRATWTTTLEGSSTKNWRSKSCNSDFTKVAAASG